MCLHVPQADASAEDRAPLLPAKARMELPVDLQKIDESAVEVCTSEIRAQQAALRQKQKEDNLCYGTYRWHAACS